MGFKDHFSAHAADYAAYRPTYPAALATWLSAAAPATDDALDVGCGSGQLSLMLADHFRRVVATDPSPQQIANAMRHPRIDYRVAAAESSGLPDAGIDLLSAAQAAHWFDLPAFFTEARRLLRPGGILALITYIGMSGGDEVARIVDHFRVETLKDYWPPERALVENAYRDIDLPFDTVAAPEMAVEVEWPLAALIGYLGTWSAVHAMKRSTGLEPLDQITTELEAAWGDPASPRRIRWPLTIVAGRA